MGKVVDDNCIAILLILAFFLFIECVDGFEGFAEYPGSLERPSGVPNMPQMATNKDPNMKPQQMKMDAPPSMMEELGVLNASPIKSEGDYLLIDASLRGMASVDSMKPVSPQVVTDRPTAGKLDSVLSKQMKGVGHLESDGMGKAPMMMGKRTQPQGPGKGKGKHKEIRLIMIYAPWCGYSKKAKPAFDKIIEKHHGQLKNGTMVKVLLYDSEKRKDMVEKYKVRGFPHYILEIEEHNGSVSEKAVNDRTFEKLEQIILSNV